MSSAATEVAISKPLKSGLIKKWTNMVTRFKVRYFVLEPDILSYYKDPTGLEKG